MESGRGQGAVGFAFDALRFYLLAILTRLSRYSERHLEMYYGDSSQLASLMQARRSEQWRETTEDMLDRVFLSIPNDTGYEEIGSVTIPISGDTEWGIGRFVFSEAIRLVDEEIGPEYTIVDFDRDWRVAADRYTIRALSSSGPSTPDQEFSPTPSESNSPTPSESNSPAFRMERAMARNSPTSPRRGTPISPSAGRGGVDFTLPSAATSTDVLRRALEVNGIARSPNRGRELAAPTPQQIDPLDPYAFWRGPHIGYDF
jgi:hypothetical protein